MGRSTGRSVLRKELGANTRPKPGRRRIWYISCTTVEVDIRNCSTYCQKRKIKCDGEYPCGQCSLKGRDCLRSNEARHQGKASVTDDQWGIGIDNPDSSGALNDALLQRLARLESQLQTLTDIQSRHVQSQSKDASDVLCHKNNAVPENPAILPASPKSHSQHGEPSNASIPTFSGETSMVHSLGQVENHLEQLGVTYRQGSSQPCSQPLTPSPEPTSHGVGIERYKSNYIQEILTSHNIALDKKQLDRCLQTFSDEVHVLYPFLHLSTIWENYHRLWDCALNWPAGHYANQTDSHLEIAQLFFCFATGKCAGGSRFANEEGRHSAGWSLYTAGMDILGEPIEGFATGGSVLLKLQILALMVGRRPQFHLSLYIHLSSRVVYLFRLDANERASTILAITISHLHQIGLHRQMVVSTMPIHEGEQFRRLWWCVYVLDRRISLETGLPFMIQDVNVDAALPLELSDNWLSRFKDSQLTVADLELEIQCEVSRKPVTPIPYLVTMVRYSRVLGKVWEALYGAKSTDTVSSPLVSEYLEYLVSETEAQAPASMAYNQDDETLAPVEGLEWWQIKQKMLMQIVRALMKIEGFMVLTIIQRWTYLRLAMRKPMLRQSLIPADVNEASNLENEVTCIHLARRIYDYFNCIPDRYPKMEFPFLHYLARTATLALGLIIKRHSFKEKHGSATLHIVRTLKRYCGQTWTSGKFIRSVVRLNHMAETVLGQDTSLVTGSSAMDKSTVNSLDPLRQTDYSGLSASDKGTTDPMRRMVSTAAPHRGNAINTLAPSPIATSYSPQQQPDMDGTSPASGFTGLITAYFDFEQAVNGSGFGYSRRLQPTTTTMLFPHAPTVHNPALHSWGGNSAGAGDAGFGMVETTQGHAQRQSEPRYNTADNVNNFDLNADWLQDLLGTGLDLAR